MALYQYQCSNCADQVEEIRKFSEREELRPCHKCGNGYYQVQLSVPARPKFTGSGFYETDYKKPKGST
jgi:putative FmdB family regulatory protein